MKEETIFPSFSSDSFSLCSENCFCNSVGSQLLHRETMEMPIQAKIEVVS